jgi:hypothetical protein
LEAVGGKNKKGPAEQPANPLFMVGATRFELATTRPPV